MTYISVCLKCSGRKPDYGKCVSCRVDVIRDIPEKISTGETVSDNFKSILGAWKDIFTQDTYKAEMSITIYGISRVR